MALPAHWGGVSQETKPITKTIIDLSLCVSANGMRGKLGKPVYLEKWVTTKTPLTAGETNLDVEFEWDESMGVPGAFIIKNNHHSQFYLGTLTLEDVPGHGRLQFVCNSWVYPAHRYNYHRVFFCNKVPSFSYRNIICCPVVESFFDVFDVRPTFHVKHRNRYASIGKKNW